MTSTYRLGGPAPAPSEPRLRVRDAVGLATLVWPGGVLAPVYGPMLLASWAAPGRG